MEQLSIESSIAGELAERAPVVEAPYSPEIEKRFSYHAPKDSQPPRYARIRSFAKDFAYLIEQACPKGREQSLAFTALEEAVMWANAAIARNE